MPPTSIYRAPPASAGLMPSATIVSEPLESAASVDFNLSSTLENCSLTYSAPSLSCGLGSETMQVGAEHIAALETQIRDQQHHIATLQDTNRRLESVGPICLEKIPSTNLHWISPLSRSPDSSVFRPSKIASASVHSMPAGRSPDNSVSLRLNSEDLDVTRTHDQLKMFGVAKDISSEGPATPSNIRPLSCKLAPTALPAAAMSYKPNSSIGMNASPLTARPQRANSAFTFGEASPAMAMQHPAVMNVPVAPGNCVARPAGFVLGDAVEYFSSSAGTWISARVLGITARGTYNLDCKPDVLPGKLRRPFQKEAACSFKVGDVVEYHSASQGGWIKCKVLAICSNDSYDLDCKPNVPVAKIRFPNAGF